MYGSGQPYIKYTVLTHLHGSGQPFIYTVLTLLHGFGQPYVKGYAVLAAQQ